MESHQQPGKGIGFITAVSQNLSGCGYVRNIQDDEDSGRQEVEYLCEQQEEW
jgi:hypothetical protein